MKAILHVPEPCAENWEIMAPENHGRHCTVCEHTVTDFTNWEIADIAAYLQARTGERICGRFRNDQLQQPFDLKILAPQVISWQGNRLHKIAAVIILCFAVATTSCNTNTPLETATEVKEPGPKATTGMVLTPVTIEADTLMPPPPVKLPEPVAYVEGSPGSSVTMGVPVFVKEPEIYRDSLSAAVSAVPPPTDSARVPAGDTTSGPALLHEPEME